MRSVLVPIPAITWGGLHAFAATIDARLRDFGWRWIVLVPEEAALVAERLSQTGVEVIPMPLSRFRRSPLKTLGSIVRMPWEFAAIAKLVQTRDIDIVQAVGAHHPHGLIISKMTGRPLVWQLHSNILPAPLRPIVGKVIAHTADVTMTNGKKIAQDFLGGNPGSIDPITFYAPVDTHKFAPDPVKRAVARAELGYTENEIVVGTVGNRVWQKNHEFLIELAGQLSPLYPGLRICIMGASHEGYQDRYNVTVLRPAAALNDKCPDFIRFLDPEARVHDLIHAIDIFVLTSHSEGVPIVLFEAMTAAKPVVSVDVGAIAEIVLNSETGFVVQPGDLKIFAQRVREMVGSEALRGKMGSAGQMRINADFPLANVVSAHVKAYERALHSKHGL